MGKNVDASVNLLIISVQHIRFVACFVVWQHISSGEKYCECFGAGLLHDSRTLPIFPLSGDVHAKLREQDDITHEDDHHL